MKRKREDSPDLSSLNLPGLAARVQLLGDEDASVSTIREMMRLLDVDISEVKGTGQKEPSFANSVWEEVAPKFGLDPGRGISQLQIFQVPRTILPPSFHREVMMESLKWLDVYRERDSQDREAARVRLMDAWHVPVCALFKGRLVDRPESAMLATEHTSDGEVEHEVSMADGILLDVSELKLYLKDEKEHLAQVILQLSSAFKMNGGRNLEPNPPVYAILTDLEKFYFLRYNGHTVARSSKIAVNSDSRDGFLFGMARVSERLFSILLQAYIDVLTAVENRSKLRCLSGDITLASSSAPVSSALARPVTRSTPKTTGTSAPVKHPSTDRWTQTLAKARSAQNILSTCNRRSMEEWEKTEEGLKVVFESVRYLDKVGTEDEWDDNQIGKKVDNILLRMIKHIKVIEDLEDLT